MTHQPTETPQFYLTAPAPCPYLAGRAERKVFTHLVGDRAAALNDILTQGGFRRSQNIAYRPACEGCRSCISVRTVVDGIDNRTTSPVDASLRVLGLSTNPGRLAYNQHCGSANTNVSGLTSPRPKTSRPPMAIGSTNRLITSR